MDEKVLKDRIIVLEMSGVAAMQSKVIHHLWNTAVLQRDEYLTCHNEFASFTLNE